MPLIDRDTLVDRPVLVNRGDEEDEQDDKQAEGTTVEKLGQGGGPTVHQMEFEPGDYNIVAGANTAAVLATGEQGGDAFNQAFVNAALQLKDLAAQGEDVRDIARFGLEKGVAEIGLTMGDIEVLREGRVEDASQGESSETETIEESAGDDVDEEVEDTEEDTDGEVENEADNNTRDIEEVEKDIEEIKEEQDG